MDGDATVAWCVDKVGLWWPLAEEDQLLRAAEAYAQCALAVRGATTKAESGAKLVTDRHRGDGIEAFAKHWATYNGDSSSGLPATASACSEVSAALEQFAQQVVDAKNRVKGIAIEIAALLAAAAATAIFSFGISLAAGGVKVALLVRKALIVKAGLSAAAASILAPLVTMMTGGALFGFLQSMLAQSGQMRWAGRESIDVGRAMTSAGIGIVAAPVGAGAVHALAKGARALAPAGSKLRSARALSRVSGEMAEKPNLLGELRVLVPDPRQLERLLNAVGHPRRLRNYLGRMSATELERAIAATQRSGIPQGFTRTTFEDFSAQIRKGAGHYGDDIQVVGSRAVGAARPKGDMDLAIRVSPERFDDILRERFGSLTGHPPNLQTVIDDARNTGKISRRDLGLMQFTTRLGQQRTWDLTKIDLAVVRVGGTFDAGPFIPLR